MIDEPLLSMLVRGRSAELLAEADRARLAASARRPRPIRVRHGRITVEIHLSADASPEQVDQVFASLARHLDGTRAWPAGRWP
jgi:hypothetical protein